MQPSLMSPDVQAGQLQTWASKADLSTEWYIVLAYAVETHNMCTISIAMVSQVTRPHA